MTACLLLTLLCAASGGVAAESSPRELWLYYPTNLLVDDNVARLESIWQRAARAGYTHVNITDSKFCRLAEMPEKYFDNVRRVRALAEKWKLQIVPSVFPIGWSNDLLWADPNLAEGLPVRDALFVVQGGEARLAADPPVELAGGDLADLAGWNWHDPAVDTVDGAAHIGPFAGGNARLVQKIAVSPFRQYHLSLRVKTREFRGPLEVKLLAGERTLNYNALGIRPTQDWTVHHTVFNSLENREIGLYIGCWGGTTGDVWFDDVKLDEVGLVNVLRRPGAPLVVRREQDNTTLTEGKDFDPVADPRLGNVPYPSNYEVWHEPPVLRTRLPDGTRLRVSYLHPMVIYEGSVMAALAEPKTLELLEDHARRVHEIWQAPAYFMAHDEIRILNWDAAAQARGQTAGAILADNVRACARILRRLNPGGAVYVWSDMFDPHHNAVDHYYLVRDSLRGSWEGLDESIVVVNWNFGKRDESLRWFAGRSHRQLIAGYYDAPLDQARQWLDSARNCGGPVTGVMYTTWQNRFEDLERFAKEVQRADGN